MVVMKMTTTAVFAKKFYLPAPAGGRRKQDEKNHNNLRGR